MVFINTVNRAAEWRCFCRNGAKLHHSDKLMADSADSAVCRVGLPRTKKLHCQILRNIS